MAKRFVSIWLPHFTTDWFSKKQPHLGNRAFVLKAQLHGHAIVTAASPLARAGGIQEGMAVADAKAVFKGLEVLDDLPGLTSQLGKRIGAWCIRFTPIAAADPPDGILLDASGCSHLWGCDEAYVTDIVKRLKDHGYTARAAMADTVGTAWAVARYGKEPFVLSGNGQIQALLSLPPAALRLNSETISSLHKLGLRQIKDFIAMPRSALRRRFGLHMLQRLSQALGEEEEPIIPLMPLTPFQERLPCLEPIVTLTGIEIALQRLLEALCSRLRKGGKGLRSAYFRCYCLDSSTQGIEIGTARPSHHEEHLFQLFSLKLSAIQPDAGIELFILEATKVESHNPVQESLWESNRSLNEEHLSELMDRLAGKFGPEAIRCYLPAEHWWPERSFKQASVIFEKRRLEWKTDRLRPVQVLSTPERIEVTAPVPDYPPMLFQYKGKRHKIVKADGPERIEQEWWIGEGAHRDYYCVEDEEGQRYWLFRSGHYTGDKSHQWFLHGFFCLTEIIRNEVHGTTGNL